MSFLEEEKKTPRSNDDKGQSVVDDKSGRVVRFQTSFSDIPGPSDTSETSPDVSGDWKRTHHTSPSGVSATDNVFYIDTKGTKTRGNRHLEHSSDLLTYKLRQVELNKKSDSIENPRVRASYRESVVRRTESEVQM